MILQIEQSQHYITFLVYTGVIVAGICLFGTAMYRNRWSCCVIGIIAALLLLSALYEIVYGIMQIYNVTYVRHRIYPLTGTFFNPGPYAGWLAAILPLCVYYTFYFQKKKAINKLYGGGYIIVSCTTLLIICLLPATMSRTAWCAAIISSIFVLLCEENIRKRCTTYLLLLKHKKWLSFLLIIILLALLIGAYIIKKDSADGRFFIWKISSIAIIENPWGYGVGTFPEIYGETQENYFALGDYTSREEWVAGCPEYAFNEYLRFAVEYGMGVLSIVILVVTYCLYEGFRYRRIGFCGALISVLVFSFGSYPFSLLEFWLLLFLLIMALLYNTSLCGKILLIFVIVLGSVGFINFHKHIMPILSAKEQWRQASYFYRVEDYHEVVDAYADLKPFLHKDYRFMFEYGYALHKIGQYEESSQILREAMKYSCDPMILNIIGKNCQAMGNYEEAEYWYFRSVHRLPNRHYPYYLLAKLYAEPAYYQYDNMVKMATVVMEKKPKVHSKAIEEMRTELSNMLDSPRNGKSSDFLQ